MDGPASILFYPCLPEERVMTPQKGGRRHFLGLILSGSGGQSYCIGAGALRPIRGHGRNHRRRSRRFKWPRLACNREPLRYV